MLAWHFTKDTLKDGRPLPEIGETLIHTGKLILCKSGYHASERLIDALLYAPGPHLWRVRLGGVIIPHENDKLVAAECTGLWRIDATDLLRSFAGQCALDVAHLWDMPAVVREYLETGREDIKAAWDAAWTPADILPASHPDDTGRTRPPLRLLRALSGPSEPPPVMVDFITLADVADRAMTVEWV